MTRGRKEEEVEGEFGVLLAAATIEWPSDASISDDEEEEEEVLQEGGEGGVGLLVCRTTDDNPPTLLGFVRMGREASGRETDGRGRSASLSGWGREIGGGGEGRDWSPSEAVREELSMVSLFFFFF